MPNLDDGLTLWKGKMRFAVDYEDFKMHHYSAEFLTAFAEEHGIDLTGCTVGGFSVSKALTDDQIDNALRVLAAIPDDEGKR